MPIRSWLFVPGDSESKLAKVASCCADAVIVDLEDAVAPENKGRAATMTAEWLGSQPNDGEYARWVRINPLDGHLWPEDLAAVMPARPDGVMVPKAAGPEQLRTLAAELYEHEGR